MTQFQYHPDITHAYPHIIGGVILAKGMHNAPTSDTLKSIYSNEQATVKSRLEDTPLSEIPSLSAWRSAISAFGVSPTKYRSAAEALARRLTKKGAIPSINTLVDIGNLISIHYNLPVAIFDTQQITGTITVHYADGSEAFTELGSNAIVYPEVGEVVFSDDKHMCIARRWCWRQSATSAANDNTTDAVITVEAHHSNATEDIQNAVDDLLDLLKTHANGTFEHGIITADNPSI